MWLTFNRTCDLSQSNGRRLIGAVLVAVCVSNPSFALAGIVANPSVATRLFEDDWHESIVKPLTPILGANGNTQTQPGGIINEATTTYQETHAGWNFNWADTDTQNSVEATFAGSYYAWVVSTTVVSGNGQTNIYVPKERGGAVLNITANFTAPQSTPTDTYSLHWIQALSGAQWGLPTDPTLDNGGAGTPYYDTRGTAGTTPGNPNAWFTDAPWTLEDEYEFNPVVDLTFQLVLALDDRHILDGKVVHDVTLLGGFQWGYTYTAEDPPGSPDIIPEPATFLMCLQCLGGVVVFYTSKRLRRRYLSE